MSAAVAWDVAPLEPASDGYPIVRSRRPALRLVPTGVGATGVGATGSGLVAGRARLRISRFGRVLVSLIGVALLTLLAVAVFGVGAAGATIERTVTVQPGQTLSEVAATELPQLSIAEGVAQIQLANAMNTSQVRAGQRLAIPTIG